MERLSGILTQVFILFILLCCGFLARRLKIFDAHGIKTLTAIILKITLPAMIIESMSSMPFTVSLLKESAIILIFSFAIYAILLGLSLPISGLFKGDVTSRGVIQFVLVFSNVGFMGFPVVEAVFGKEALFYTAIYNLPFNLLTFTLGVYLLIRHDRTKAYVFDSKVFFSPAIVAVLLGFIVFITDLDMPLVVSRPLNLLGSVTTPLSMLAVGGMLAGTSLRTSFTDSRLYILSIFRLLLWPCLVFLVLRMLTSNFFLAAIPALITAMPAAANTAILAHEYDANTNLAAQTVFTTTLLSVLSIPLIAWLLEFWRF